MKVGREKDTIDDTAATLKVATRASAGTAWVENSSCLEMPLIILFSHKHSMT
jgi:hypothetical protein